MKAKAIPSGIFVGLVVFVLLIGTSAKDQMITLNALAEKPTGQNDVLVAMKQKDKITLLAIKNIDAPPIYEFKIKIIDGGIKFIKARGWDRDRVDPSTVIVQTDDRPINAGKSLIVMLLANANASYEWTVFDKNKKEVTRGNLGKAIELPRASLKELEFVVKEYSVPDAASFPLFPLYDQKRNVIWISDFTHPRIWKFKPETGDFESFQLNGEASMKLASDSKGRLWFTDTKTITFGYIDPDTGFSKTFKPPVEGFMIDLQIDSNDNVWIAILDKSKIVRFDSDEESFKVFELDSEDSRPAAILIDKSGRVWFTQIGLGSIGRIDPISEKIIEYQPSDGKLITPMSLMQDSNGNIWIGEHGGTTIARFDPESLKFQRYVVPDQGALVLGMVEDRYGNIWYAEHVTNNIAVLEPESGLTKLVRVPTGAPLVQWLTIDKQGNIWFTEPSNAKIGSIAIIEKTS